MACCMLLLRRGKKLLWNGSPLHLGDARRNDQEDLGRLIKRNVDVGLAPWKRDWYKLGSPVQRKRATFFWQKPLSL